MAGMGPRCRNAATVAADTAINRAERDVDAARPDHERQAQRHDGHRHHLDELEPQVEVGEEVRVLEGVDHDEGDHPDVDAVVLEEALPVDVAAGCHGPLSRTPSWRGRSRLSTSATEAQRQGGRPPCPRSRPRRRARRSRRPSRSTMSRSDPSTTSSRSELMSTTAMPLLRQLAHERLDLRLRAHVDAARRIVQDEQPRRRCEHPGQQHLLLVAARQLRDLLVRAGCLDAQAAR